MEKRSITVSIKMKPTDLEKINRAAAKLWPGAVLTQSTKLLSLALMCAETALIEKPKKK